MLPLLMFIIFIIFIFLLRQLTIFINEMISINQEINDNTCTQEDQVRLFMLDGNRFPRWEEECLKNDTKIKSFINTSINILTNHQ